MAGLVGGDQPRGEAFGGLLDHAPADAPDDAGSHLCGAAADVQVGLHAHPRARAVGQDLHDRAHPGSLRPTRGQSGALDDGSPLSIVTFRDPQRARVAELHGTELDDDAARVDAVGIRRVNVATYQAVSGAGASAIEELQLIQERRDLTAELASLGSGVDIGEIEDSFVSVAKGYGERKGISYASWRDVGVSAATLKRAGISRGA